MPAPLQCKFADGRTRKRDNAPVRKFVVVSDSIRKATKCADEYPCPYEGTVRTPTAFFF